MKIEGISGPMRRRKRVAVGSFQRAPFQRAPGDK